MDSRLSSTWVNGGGGFRVLQVDWDSVECDAVRAIRLRVFVDEQKVPPELELDDIDPGAVHVLAYDENNRACGTGRLFAEPGEPATGHIGRMAVLPQVRGAGCGAAILGALL